MNLKTFLFVLAIVCQINDAWGRPRTENVTAQSCLDYFKRGIKTNGYYSIINYGVHGLVHTVYCDFESEPGFAWTLVESFAIKNKLLPEFRIQPLKINAPVNANSPNWDLYRMSYLQMNHLKSQSTHWRFTCSFPAKPINLYRDYARASFKDFDVLNFVGGNTCNKMEYINIRGHQCAQCTAPWFAKLNSYTLHVDSTATSCEFKPTNGAVSSEDNFGYYGSPNNKFRCSSSPEATTNYWFGGYY